ncbi:putative ATP-dependent RNA helicase ddx28 [Mortierella claussenii]|nr:putative ATP-dependent RNA helicase ddx28 [Mortierella claussenii]
MSAFQFFLQSAVKASAYTHRAMGCQHGFLGSSKQSLLRNTSAHGVINMRPFSTSWPAAVYAKRTPRPKKRTIKEQKLKESWSNVRSSPQKEYGAKSAGKTPTPEQGLKSKTRQWKMEGMSGRSSSGTTIGKSSSSRQRISSTSVSVTSLEKGSRNPQYEHSFAPGFASQRSRLARNGPPLRTGNAGRDKAAAAEKTLIEAGAKRRSGPRVRGFVPVRFALKPIASDVSLNLVSNRKIPKFRYKEYALAGETSMLQNNTGKEEGAAFAKPHEDVQDMLDKVANSRFEKMGLHPDVEKGIMELLVKSVKGSQKSTSTTGDDRQELWSVIKPTEIQAMTIPASIDLNKKSPYTLCAAETGSGKTLAYLAPVLHRLKVQEDEAVKQYRDEGGIDDEGSKVRALNTIRYFNQPRAIVLLPSRELVSQISAILKELSHSVKLRTLALSHAMTLKSIAQRLASGPIDIIVATPASLLDYLAKDDRDEGEEDRRTRGGTNLSDENRLLLNSLTDLVVDEADSMFDRGFGDEVSKIVKQAKSIRQGAKNPARITVVSATLPKKVSDVLDVTLPGMLKITTPSLHKSLPGLHQTFLDLKPYFGNRPKAILDILVKQQQLVSGKRKENTLVFCNTKHSCEILYNHLKSNKVPGLLGILHGDALNRDEILKQFTDDEFVPPPPEPSKGATSGTTPTGMLTKTTGFKGGKILISTDIASRGIDTTAVNHVVLYDFPVTIVDYLHRVGRTARGGRGGRATCLVGRKDRNLAERIMLGIRMGKVLS